MTGESSVSGAGFYFVPVIVCTDTEGAKPQKLSGIRTPSCEQSGKWHSSVHRRGHPQRLLDSPLGIAANLSGSVTEGI